MSGPQSAGRYQELAAAVDQHCPVLDLFANPVPVSRTLVAASGSSLAPGQLPSSRWLNSARRSRHGTYPGAYCAGNRPGPGGATVVESAQAKHRALIISTNLIWPYVKDSVAAT